MVHTPFSTKTGRIPLELAETIKKMANEAWENGSFLEKISKTTQDLLKFWNPHGSFGELRASNFHDGQWQAIINAIYVHEVLKIKDVRDMYMSTKPELLRGMDSLDLKKEKLSYPKYCIKMATGTGKTWVLHALLIWQYLNAKHEKNSDVQFSKNFLLVAPGIIVYERLLDAFLGKRTEEGPRSFTTSDFKQFEEIFLPPNYKEELLGFIQSNVAAKEEIGRKVTGEGLIAITNWHLLVEETESDEIETPLDSPQKTIEELLPITPGTGVGHSLDELDQNYFGKQALDYLVNLDNLVTFNDEAHHLSEFKKSFEVIEKKWQNALSKIAEKKKNKFIQIDFSATPYTATGSGQKRSLNYFPHIIVNFELVDAIKQGLVKTVAIDKRKELTALPLEFKAEREGRNVRELSEGQRLMLRAGIKKLKILEDGFTKLDKSKYPKMMIICEDTTVVPFVGLFLKQEGISEEDILEIHSNKQGEIGQKEWDSVKQKLFSIDKHQKPKIIISVLMLREGFDVNNICVIVPLRASSSYILLEQSIGRGLRLMWRGPEYEETRREVRESLLIKKEEPKSYLDILSIIEHPMFVEFYDRVLEGAIGAVQELPQKNKITGDIISISLKEDYEDYDLFWPILIHDKEEELIPVKLSQDGKIKKTRDLETKSSRKPNEKEETLPIELTLDDLEQFPIKLDELKPLINQKGDVFKSEEMTVKTRFGEYHVTSDIFTATSYNTFIQKIVNAVSAIPVRINKRTIKSFPVMQINSAFIANLTDNYIRQKLFGENFDPLKDNNWQILLLTEARIIQHIVKNVAKSIYQLQNNFKIHEAVVQKKYFSEIGELKVRNEFSIDVAKSIYSKISYPSNKGGFERNFIEFIDSDSKVNSFMKINEYYHDFASVLYIRSDGMLANYHPDFLVKIENKMYLVETKAEKDLNNEDVRSKRLATIDWLDKINQLNSNDRMDCAWSYVLLGEKTFYGMSKKNAETEEILEYAKLTRSKIKGTLGDFLGIKETAY